MANGAIRQKLDEGMSTDSIAAWLAEEGVVRDASVWEITHILLGGDSAVIAAREQAIRDELVAYDKDLATRNA